MWSAISARLAEAIVGLLVAGVVMALLVTTVGPAAGTAVAVAVSVACVTASMWVARLLRGRNRRP